MGSQSKLNKRIAKLNKAVAKLNKEETAKSKYAMDEPVRMKASGVNLRAFVHDIVAIDKGNAGMKYYYDLILMEPTYKGSAILHNVLGISETQLSK